MGVIQHRNLGRPDEIRRFPLGSIELTELGAYTLGRGVVEPGFRWTTHLAPIMGTPLCPIHHVQLVLEGRFGVRMADGEEVVFEPNDLFDVPPGHDAWVVGDERVVLLDVAGNIGGLARPPEQERVVTTLLMSDIVDSTRLARELGDGAWRQVLAGHNRIVRVHLERHRGTEVNTTGDGFLATFASAAGALRCAREIRDAVREVGVEIRVGVHTGEVELIADDIGGIAVHAAARLMALGGPSEVLVSSITRDLVDGAGLDFEARGTHAVKGLDRPLEVHRLRG